MATIIGVGGNSFYTGKGVSWGCMISSADYKNLMPDNEAYSQYKISVQNHSYGVGIENFYGSDAAAYDASIIANPYLLHVFSSGNTGNDSSTTGAYTNINGFANLTGSFKMAKNILTVGSLNSVDIIPALSSKGPAYDGRVKPELVAYGESGSSEAAALVSGIALLLQDTYKKLHNGQLPENALLKSMLLNAADDVGNRGIDFSSGYGNVNAFRSINNLVDGKYFHDSVIQSEVKSFSLHIPPNSQDLKLTLVWNDPAAPPNSFNALTNDLDLELQHDETKKSWSPWVLNSSPNKDSLQALPVRKRDSLNVVEQISIDFPLEGNYAIKVKGHSVFNAAQSFYIAYQWDTTNNFHWKFPTYNDNIVSGTANVIRWDSYYQNQKGKLFFSSNNGSSWQLIDSSVDLGKNKYSWFTPDTFSRGILKMEVQNKIFATDTFNISSPLSLSVGYS
jgi:hypothetical protein